MFDFIQTLIAQTDQDTVSVLYDRKAYGLDKPWMQEEQDGEYQHPCVRYVTVNDIEVKCWYSNTNENGHFEIPKIVFGIGSNCGGFYFDRDGKYGLSQYAAGVLGTEEELENIFRAMSTQKFMDVMDACMTTTQRIHPKVFGMFKKDWWKEFLEE